MRKGAVTLRSNGDSIEEGKLLFPGIPCFKEEDKHETEDTRGSWHHSEGFGQTVENGLTRTSWSSTKRSVKSYTWGGKTPGIRHAGIQKRTWRSQWSPSWTWASSVSLGKGRRPVVPWAALGNVSPAGLDREHCHRDPKRLWGLLFGNLQKLPVDGAGHQLWVVLLEQDGTRGTSRCLQPQPVWDSVISHFGISQTA